MSAELEKAKALLGEGFTLAAYGESVYTTTLRGVKPLIMRLESGMDFHGYAVADKVIGKAAALLYVLLGPNEIYAGVISRPALIVLEGSGINTEYGTLVDAIENRTKTGFCPMETAVRDTDNPNEALEIIKKKLADMAGGTGK